MKVDVEELSSLERKLTVEVPAERVDDEIDLAYDDVNRKARIPGFRPGKVPRKHLERKFGEYVSDMVREKLFKETVQTALERKQISPVSEPLVEPGEVKPGQSFTYTMRFEVKPEVEASNYKGLETFREVIKVTDEVVDEAMTNIRERHAVFKDPEPPRPAKEGDYLLLDISAMHDGQPVPTERHENMRYPLGEHAYIPDIATHLEGMEAGESRTFTAGFPDEHPRKDLAGKEVEYTVILKEIKEKILPDLDDELAREVGDFKSIDELRARTRENLEKYYERLGRARMENRIIDMLIEGNSFSVPQAMVTRRSQELVAESLRSVGMTRIGQEDFHSLADTFRDRAEKEVRAGFLMDAIARQENIEVTDDDIQNRISELAEEQGINPDKMRDRLADEESRMRLRASMLEQKTLDFLVNNAKIEKREVDMKEIEKAEAEK